MSATDHQLRRWRRLLLLRDSRSRFIGGQRIRQSYCVLCDTSLPAYKLQAHHIYPRSLYRSQSLDLMNGVMLCVNCHLTIVHGGNPARDVQTKVEGRWLFFIQMFTNHCLSQQLIGFADENESRLPTPLLD